MRPPWCVLSGRGGSLVAVLQTWEPLADEPQPCPGCLLATSSGREDQMSNKPRCEVRMCQEAAAPRVTGCPARVARSEPKAPTRQASAATDRRRDNGWLRRSDGKLGARRCSHQGSRSLVKKPSCERLGRGLVQRSRPRRPQFPESISGIPSIRPTVRARPPILGIPELTGVRLAWICPAS